MKFNEIFTKYIKLVNCTSKELAKETNLSESIISRYKNGSRIPDEINLKKLSNSIAKLSNNKYKREDILYEFNNSSNICTIDFEIVKTNLSKIITALNINISELAKALNFDPSYLSRIKNGDRIPSNKKEFVEKVSLYIIKKYNNDEQKNIISNLINCNVKDLNTITLTKWLTTNKIEIKNEINNFLNQLDNFNLNDYIKAIKFDKLKVPTIPFYKAKSKNYYGIEEMKTGELDFFKATVLAKSKEEIFMCSDMPMEDMAKDIDFGKKWMFGIAMCLKKGLHLNIVHNLDRPFNEMMLGLESWIPIYMTGQISPYYFKNYQDNVYNHLNYTSGVAALTGECINGAHDKGKYYLSTNHKEIEYYRNKTNMLLKKASPLMQIYREENIEKYNNFLTADENILGKRNRTLSSLPLFTIKDSLLKRILNRNNISKDDINKITQYKNDEKKHIEKILMKNQINDIIPHYNENTFQSEKMYLALDDIFYNQKIEYSYKEYLEHYNSTVEFKNKNYKVSSNNYQTFKNINITVVKNNYVIITKNANPTIHFIIKHPKLVDAIASFEPIVKEKDI